MRCLVLMWCNGAGGTRRGWICEGQRVLLEDGALPHPRGEAGIPGGIGCAYRALSVSHGLFCNLYVLLSKFFWRVKGGSVAAYSVRSL